MLSTRRTFFVYILVAVLISVSTLILGSISVPVGIVKAQVSTPSIIVITATSAAQLRYLIVTSTPLAVQPQYVIVTSTPLAGTSSDVIATVSGSLVNIRSAPGTANNVIGTAKSGDKLTVLAMTASQDWFHIRTVSDLEGWVTATLVRVTSGSLLRVTVSNLIISNAVAPVGISPAGAGSTGSGSGSSGLGNTAICPKNCTEARLMAVSPQFAASCGLDRDHDGVACYGD